MSGSVHQAPFRHYHRREDGTTYFAISGEIHAAPTCQERVDALKTGRVEDYFKSCVFDMDAALTIKDWESPSEFEPFRREVETALGLPLTLNAKEKVRDAINELKCEWKADYDYPDFLSVYPRVTGNAMDDDKVCWSWGTANGPWGGNDRACEESVHWADMPESAEPKRVAEAIVKHMRWEALKRVGWLNDFAESCVKHIERTSATSPNASYPNAGANNPVSASSGFGPYDEAWRLVNTWRRS